MINQKPSFLSRLANSGLLIKAIVAEMTGRDDPNTVNGTYGGRIRAQFGMYKAISTFDVSRTSYSLSRAIFYANLYTDRKTGTEYGSDYLLGAPFGKPIVNIAAGFAVGSPIRIVESDSTTDEEIKDGKTPTDPNADPNEIDNKKPENSTIANVNQWLEENRNLFFMLARNSFRDGDDFLSIDDDGTVLEVPPEFVDIITNPNNPQLIEGYDIWSSFPDPKDPSGATTITYVDEIRRTYRRRMEVDKSQKRTLVQGTLNTYLNAEDGGLEERELPIVHFANEKEGRMLYGISEFQNLYFLMANYHAILAAAIKGNIYNSTAVPVIQGVKNMKQFLSQNFTQDKDGNYILKWDNQKMLVVGEGGSVQILQADGTAADAQTILNILFWLISQSSETPEFAFGTAVQSSKASVSEQTPMLIKKAIRKQGQLEEPIRRVIDLYINRMSKLKPEEFDANTQFTIDMPDILDEDLNINIQIVNALLEKGIITEETAMTMLNIGKYVKNFEEELKKAKQQQTARNPVATDVFGQPINNASTENTKIDQATLPAKQAQIDQMKANKTTKKVAEMLEKNIDALTLEQIQEMNPFFVGGSEDTNPKAEVVTLPVKSGNPFRQKGGKFGPKLVTEFNENHDPKNGEFTEGKNSGSLPDSETIKKGTVFYHGTEKENVDSLIKSGFDIKKNKKGYAESPHALFVSKSKSNNNDHSAGSYGSVILKVTVVKKLTLLDGFSKTYDDTMGHSKGSKDSAEWAKKLAKQGYDGINEGNGEYQIWSFDKVKFSKTISEMIITEFNENHDELGRFANGSSSGYNDLSGKNDAYISKIYGEAAADNSSYTDEEQAAVSFYKRVGFEPINEVLRYGYSTGEEKRAKEVIPILDKMQKVSLVENTILWRGGEFNTRIDLGDKITDKGFISTSFDRGVAHDFARESDHGGYKYLFKLNAPKNTKGLYLGGDEVEFLLNRKSEFFVKSISKPDSSNIITVGLQYEK